MSRAEDDIQKSLVRELEIRGIWFNATMNEGRRNPKQAHWAKQMGLKSGVPDIMIYDPPPAMPGRIGTALELKSEKGKVTPSQRLWLSELERRGWAPAVGKGIDGAVAECRRLGYW